MNNKSPSFLHRAVVALGSNVDRDRALPNAITALGVLGDLVRVSPFYETPYEGDRGPQSSYLNAAALLHTNLSAWDLFQSLLNIEKAAGRTDKGMNLPRVIDLDLIFFDDMILDLGSLILPHPRAHLRQFVMSPVAAIVPDWIHPVLRRAVASLL